MPQCSPMSVCVFVCVSAGPCGHYRTSKSDVMTLCFILANEDAVSGLLGRSGNMHSEVTSKAG